MSTSQPGRDVVVAARAGDQQALDTLVAGYLPLLYNVVGRALDGHPDVDDVVQETLLRALRGFGDLRDPDSFRSWLVAIAMRGVRDRQRTSRPAALDAFRPDDDVRDPGADFVDLTILRLGLAGQRRETAEATRWLDGDDRELLALWWMEAAGELTRQELSTALGLSPEHAAVRVQRMRAQLEGARSVVRALAARPRCPELAAVVAPWDGTPSSVWRKRLARHTRDCEVCAVSWSGMVPPERLLVSFGLVPVPLALATSTHGLVAGQAAGHPAAVAGWLGAAPLKPALAAVFVAARSQACTATWSSTTCG